MEASPLWLVGFTLAGVVVIVVAVLLITIILLARRIAGLAATALAVVREIDTSTKPIWSLNTTNKVAHDLLGGAQAIDANAKAIASVLAQADRNRAA
jgi:hypothetical protein